MPDGLVAFWDFTEDGPPYAAKAGIGRYPLHIGGTPPARVKMKPFGGGLQFNGESDYLIIPAAQVGALNVAQFGDEVTVVAWIKRPQEALDANAFIAGMWQEDDHDPKRQYALFSHLPMYGGWNRACGHVSDTGGPSPNLMYSRDYSASARTIGKNVVRCIGFTYDGYEAKSYVDGIADVRLGYTELDTPLLGEGKTYDKNPYRFEFGLNRKSVSDFTVGAVKLTGGMGNFFNSRLGALAVFRRALTDEEMMQLHLAARTSEDAIQYYDFYAESTEPAAMGDYGWIVTGGAPLADCTKRSDMSWAIGKSAAIDKGFALLDGESAADGLHFFEPTRFGRLRLNRINRIQVTMNGTNARNSVKLCLNIDGQWFATKTDYFDADGGFADDWSGAVTHELAVIRNADDWLEFHYERGRTLSVGGMHESSLPDGEVLSWGILANSIEPGSIIRLSDIAFR